MALIFSSGNGYFFVIFTPNQVNFFDVSPLTVNHIETLRPWLSNKLHKHVEKAKGFVGLVFSLLTLRTMRKIQRVFFNI